MTKINLPRDISLITTYRCQMRCKMCDIWNNPSDKKKEFTAKDLEMLPKFKGANITGGEPFQRADFEDIIEVMSQKADDIVISTSGWHVNRALALAERFPDIGFRISLEGLSQKNDYLRGREGGFDRGLKLLLGLMERGVKNVGFGITVSDNNSDDMLHLYYLAKDLGVEFSTASFHNSYYFHKDDNVIKNKNEVIDNFKKIIELLLKENNPKSWYRAFFNLGLINYINGGKRMLPCEAGTENFFIEPYGDVYPCNGLEDRIWKESMGNIFDYDSFEELWNSEQANRVRSLVRKCPKNCWMVGTASPVMKKHIKYPTKWVIKNKIKSLLGKDVCLDDIPFFDVNQDPRQGDLDYERMQSFTDTHGVKSDPTLPLVEIEKGEQ